MKVRSCEEQLTIRHHDFSKNTLVDSFISLMPCARKASVGPNWAICIVDIPGGFQTYLGESIRAHTYTDSLEA
jgi:hypothetical protein